MLNFTSTIVPKVRSVLWPRLVLDFTFRPLQIRANINYLSSPSRHPAASSASELSLSSLWTLFRNQRTTQCRSQSTMLLIAGAQRKSPKTAMDFSWKRKPPHGQDRFSSEKQSPWIWRQREGRVRSTVRISARRTKHQDRPVHIWLAANRLGFFCQQGVFFREPTGLTPSFLPAAVQASKNLSPEERSAQQCC